ncbi:MAG TPA: GDL motif peptide-associated radical SAM/SPASM maturase [Albitalea sp.]|nr:GDL motif peptide-associated radical SAM/SPASM maturase [Albitalea sp.]
MSDNANSLPCRIPEAQDYRARVPVHVVWELTLACNLKCRHCGSRAGIRRPDELSTAQALDLVAQLAKLGTRELTVIGGEAYLRNDWVDIIRRATDLGILCAMQTGARALTPARLKAGADAGLRGLGVSIDGLVDLHDEVRGVPGAYANAFKVLEDARDAGLRISVNTQIGPRTIDDLPALMDQLIAARVTHWQLQLTVAMGNAVDNEELLLQPYQLADLMPLIARLYHEGQRQGLLIVPGNNIGYFGPYEHLWRNASSVAGYWTGCEAGYTVLGIEADGTIKGCPSLPTGPYAGGNVRDMSVADIWRDADEIGFRRLARTSELWGHCRTCYYAEVCDAGCTWTTHSLLGRPGNNPYCHHRVLELAKRGIRERIVKVKDASDAPFAVGKFEIVEEPLSAGKQEAVSTPLERDAAGKGHEVFVLGLDDAQQQLRMSSAQQLAEQDDRMLAIPKLHLCGECEHFVKDDEVYCPFCGTNVEEAARRSEAVHQRRVELMNQVRALISGVT